MAIDKEKLKVLIWRPEYYGAQTEGGIHSEYYGFTDGFLKLGHDVLYAAGGKHNLAKEVKSFFIPYSRFYMNYPEVLALPYNKKSVKAILKIIEQEKPDFLFQQHHDFLYGGAMVKKKTGIPFLLHVDSIEYWVKKNWGKLYFGNLLKWAEEIQLDQCDGIFTVSQAVKDQLTGLGIDENKIIITPCGVDPQQFTPEIDGTQVRKKFNIEDKFVCGFTGTFGQWHGLDVIAKAMKYVVDKIPNAFFLLVGDGMLRADIEEIIKKDNMEKYSHITGIVNFRDVPKYMAACDVMLSPCVGNADDTAFFNSPVKMFEYISMGKPVVATNLGQQGEVIRDNYNGLHCEENSPEDLAEKIIQLYQDKELAGKLGKNGRLDALNYHDWLYDAVRIIRGYENIINGRRVNDIDEQSIFGNYK